MSESQAMKEIHDIRERHYEEAINMSSSEYVLTLREDANKAKKRIEEIGNAKQK